MGRGVRLSGIFVGLSALALAATPAAAQDSAANNSSSTNTATETIGPRELRDFSLNGTVTRQAEQPAPAPAVTVPAPDRTAATQPRPQPNRSAPAPTAAERTAPATAVADAPAAGTPALPAPIIPPSITDATAALPAPSLDEPSSMAIWPWLLAGLVAAAGAFLLYRRRNQDEGYAAAGAGADEFAFDLAPVPQPVAQPRAPVAPPPLPPTPASTGIVSSSLRPDLAFEIHAERAVVDEKGATIEFEVEVRNNGSAPARDVQIEACMVNAGPAQDQELGAFFAHPSPKTSAIPQIPPLSQIRLKSAVRLSIENMRQFEIEGRKLFVPLVGVNAMYRGPSGARQTAASYLIGRDNKTEKLAPLRLDLGPKIFRGLGVRQHSLSLRT